MKPGRELDALVAEKVMGFCTDPGLPSSYPWLDDYGTAFLYPPEWNEELDAWPSTQGRQAETWFDYVPHYSTSIADAWAIVDLLQQYGIIRVSNGDGDSYDCDFMPFDGGAFGKYQFANAGGSEQPTESWPHAICLTALKAVKEERETK